MKIKDKICMAVTLIIVILLLAFRVQIQDTANKILVNAGLKSEQTHASLYAGISEQLFEYDCMIANGKIYAYAPDFVEDDIYTFLQGPKSWANGIAWSGEWCLAYTKGQYFGEFGCGFCCAANLYCTFSDYKCSPLDAYEYAKEVTGYAPTKKSAAIDWGNLKILLQKMGFQCDVYYKPATYEEFQEQIKNCKSAVVLVCSDNDDTFWQDIPGHYVTISLYNDVSDDVFLADSGSPTNNRTRVPLRYVYDALKTTSKFQYLTVDSYAENHNQWKHNGIDDRWVAPY